MSSPGLKVQFEPDARIDAEAIDAWRRENRAAAPSLFRDELERWVGTVAMNPNIGRVVRERITRRVLLPRTRYHLYFRVDANTLVIVAIWHAARGSGPERR